MSHSFQTNPNQCILIVLFFSVVSPTTFAQCVSLLGTLLWEIIFTAIYWIIVYTIVALYVSVITSTLSFIFRMRSLYVKFEKVSVAQCKLISKYYNSKEGVWNEFPATLKQLMLTAGKNQKK